MNKTTMGGNGILMLKRFQRHFLITVSCLAFASFYFLSSFFVKENSDWMCNDLKYSYQIIMKGRSFPNLPITICDEIQEKRKQSQRVIIKYSDYVSIEIFSKDEITNLNTNTKEVRYE